MQLIWDLLRFHLDRISIERQLNHESHIVHVEHVLNISVVLWAAAKVKHGTETNI